MAESEKEKCFVIMPISDCDGYEEGHFTRVYEDIIKPAVDKAGYMAIRADEVKQANLIHVDILQKLLAAPIAICDLSTRNPNVLFELGIRQAFDKPVVLIQEKDTPRIFDIASLRCIDYSKDMKYHEVIESQIQLEDAIKATASEQKEGGGVNSIIKLLALGAPAKMPELTDSNREELELRVLSSQLNELKAMVGIILHGKERNEIWKNSPTIFEYEKIRKQLDRLAFLKISDVEQANHEYLKLAHETEELMKIAKDKMEVRRLMNLMNKIYEQRDADLKSR